MIALFLCLVVFGLLYDCVTTLWIFHWFGAGSEKRENVPPVTFFRPIKAGVPNLEEKLCEFLESVDPLDQVLIGIDADDFTSQVLTRSALAHFPDLEVSVTLCQRTTTGNPKIHKLIQLAPQARHNLWIVLDSEISNFAHFLPNFREEWQRKDFSVLSAPYRFRRLTLQSLPVLTTLLPGLAVLSHFGKIQNTLGACLAVTREQMMQLGGWESLASQLAEDYEIGHRLSQLGVPVSFSRTVVELDNDPANWLDTLRQLHRVSVTYRICQPWGFAGSLTAMPFLWSLALLPVIGWKVAMPSLLTVSLFRMAACLFRASRIGWPVGFWKMLILLPVSSLLEILLWFLAWLPLPVFWAGRSFRISADGTLRVRSTL